MTVTEKTWPVADLLALAAALLEKSGLDHAKAETVAELLVEADLMGHDTHGLALLPRYLEEIAAGAMTIKGEPDVIRDTGSCITWDGRRLPGVWLVAMALDLALDRAMIHGVATAVIRNSHHIGCLAAYLPRATERGYMLIISSTDPSNASVAPFGGTQAVFTPNPVAVGIPTGADPILIDTSASITTNKMGCVNWMSIAMTYCSRHLVWRPGYGISGAVDTSAMPVPAIICRLSGIRARRL